MYLCKIQQLSVGDHSESNELFDYHTTFPPCLPVMSLFLSLSLSLETRFLSSVDS